jgi:PPK2 family polyphosphate:nucleotide phosphotransferase
MMSLSTNFRVRPGEKVDLDSLDADWKPKGLERAEAEEQLARLTSRLRDLQHMMYAEDKRSLLVILQGRDAAGKDGTIRHVFGPMNPQGCKVTSFKVPSTLEASHDFLWRCHHAAPRRGQVGIFNRSHYEDVLVVRVHDLVPKKQWQTRYEHINNFEQLLADSGTTVLKFMLHIDRDEQLERFRKRIDRPHKNWKISEADYSERRFWDDYTEAFNEVFRRCSTDTAPWFVIPSNRKWARNFAIATIVAETMETLGMAFPEPTVDMDEIKEMYHQASNAD